mgnify:CR=1 FL=1
MASKVKFTEMKYGTKEDYLLLHKHEKKYAGETAYRILKFMSGLNETLEGYQVSRLEHSLQTATRALRAGECEEIVVAALLHDIGDILAPLNHAAIAAEILKPFVSRQVHWMLEKHAVFQGYYFWDKVGLDKNARDKYRGHPAFEMTERFCGEYDQTSSDPNYDTLALETFLPMVERVFGREPWGPHSRSEWPLED